MCYATTSITIVEQIPVTGTGWKLAAKESKIAPRKDLLKVQCKNFQFIHNCLNNISGKASKKAWWF